MTHFYEFAHDFFDRKRADALFLRAERLTDGRRTFKLIEGEPFDSSHGEDLYKKIFVEGTKKEDANSVANNLQRSTLEH